MPDKRGMNRYVKKIAEAVLPKRALLTLRAIRSRNYQKRLHREWGVWDATQEAIRAYGLTVQAGPFRGMQYPKASLMNRNGIPILFGTYELEVHPVIEEVAAQRFDCIVDIGAAEGYYAVGLALRTKTRVHAFDCEPRELRYLRQMAKLNGVDHLIQTGAWCDAAHLAALVGGRRALVISDCEGYEVDLFNEACVAALARSDLIIEIHENTPNMNVQDHLRERFASSHRIQTITFDSSNRGGVPPNWQKFAREIRDARQAWLYLSSLKG